VDLAAVFIDGGYLTSVLRRFGKLRIDYGQFAKWCAEGFAVFRVYYYDCLPYLSSNVVPEEPLKPRRSWALESAFIW